MPFELGLDFGCKNFGGSPFDQKEILVLEEKKYQKQISLSDLAGYDAEAHDGDYVKATRKVCNWINSLGGNRIGPSKVLGNYSDFRAWHYDKLWRDGFSTAEIADYPTGKLIDAMTEWMCLEL
ncbi:MAG: hypothetical protein OXF74_09025 [Rhodobacteraceae bacterium]|nr:hypothetical protein [Paracoccaceae bacterium]